MIDEMLLTFELVVHSLISDLPTAFQRLRLCLTCEEEHSPGPEQPFISHSCSAEKVSEHCKTDSAVCSGKKV